MSGTAAALVAVAAMLGCFALGIPVAVAMAAVGVGGLVWLKGVDVALGILARELYGTMSSYGLVVIPLFVFMGQLAAAGGLGERVYEAAWKLTGGRRGGLAVASVVGAAAFGAVCGSGPATAATMAGVSMGPMRRFGYSPWLAAGAVAGGGSLGMLVPPSVVLIIYGALTRSSIGQLFVAAMIPAALTTAMMVAAVAGVCRLTPGGCPKAPRAGLGERLKALGGLWEVGVVFGVVMVGLGAGWFTPTEAGAVGCALVGGLGLARGQLRWAEFKRAVKESLCTSAMVVLLVAGAVVFGRLIALTRAAFNLAGTIAQADLPGWAVMGLIMAVYIVGGCFVDALALMMLTVPIFLPVVQALGYSPVWFGVLIVLLTQIGVLTPPVGINAYVVHSVAPWASLGEVFRGTALMLLPLVLAAAAMVAFPQMAGWLPGLIFTP